MSDEDYGFELDDWLFDWDYMPQGDEDYEHEEEVA